MLVVTRANATSPCTGDGCIDETSAVFIVPYDFFEAKCSELNPGLRTQYAAVAANFLRNEDADFLKKLRASKPYADVRAEIELKAKALSVEDLRKACDDFAKQSIGPTKQSTQPR